MDSFSTNANLTLHFPGTAIHVLTITINETHAALAVPETIYRTQLDGGEIEDGAISFDEPPQPAYNVLLYSITDLQNASHTLTIAPSTIEPLFIRFMRCILRTATLPPFAGERDSTEKRRPTAPFPAMNVTQEEEWTPRRKRSLPNFYYLGRKATAAPRGGCATSGDHPARNSKAHEEAEAKGLPTEPTSASSRDQPDHSNAQVLEELRLSRNQMNAIQQQQLQM
ncbi:hypothetical protein B0H19DRAFT_1386150 [Mycena capillaripes]|nr:hypothetical protein B0H19DRAFT_1386150 [Mycena capillaripes]